MQHYFRDIPRTFHIYATLWTRRACRGRGKKPILGSVPYWGSENSSPFWRGERILVGRTEPRRPHIWIRGTCRAMARVGIPKCDALFRSASASSVSRVMLGDTRGGEDEAEGEGGRSAAHVAVIVLMGQIASVTNELSARGWLPWDGRRVYHAPTSSSLRPDCAR